MGRILALAIFILIASLYLTGTGIPSGRTHEAGTVELSFACAEGENDKESSIPTGASKQFGTQSSEGNSKSQRCFELLSRLACFLAEKWFPIAQKNLTFEDFSAEINCTVLRRECRSCDGQWGVKCLKNHSENCLRPTKREEAGNFLLPAIPKVSCLFNLLRTGENARHI